MRAMFDAIAPRYELVNRVMTFGLDAALAPAHRRATCACRPGSLVLDVAAGTGDLSRELARQGQRAVATDLSYGMLARRPRRRRPRPGRRGRACPFADGAFDGVTCGYAPAQLHRPGRHLRPRWPACCARAGAVAARGRRAARRRSGARRFRVWFRHVVPFIGAAALGPPPPTATCRARPPTCPTPTRSSRCCTARASPRSTTGRSWAVSASSSSRRGPREARPARGRPGPTWARCAPRRPGAAGWSSPPTRSAPASARPWPRSTCRPGRAARPPRRRLAGLELSGDDGPAGSGVVAFGALPFDPGAAGRLEVPEGLVTRDRRGRVAHRARGRRPAGARSRASRRRPRSPSVCARSPTSPPPRSTPTRSPWPSRCCGARRSTRSSWRARSWAP